MLSFDIGYEDHVSTVLGLGTCYCAIFRCRAARYAVTCRTLNPLCLAVTGNPNYVPHPAAFWAFRTVANVNYVFVSPLFLLLTKTFFPAFFRKVQVLRTDDLHLLQFFTKPTLNIHIIVTSYAFFI